MQFYPETFTIEKGYDSEHNTNSEKKLRGIGIYSQKEFEDMNPIKCY